MKYFFYFLVSLILLPASALISQNGYTYIGVDGCAMCHKTEKQGSQQSIWKNSKHSQAFETLKTEKANQIAKEKGFQTPASETPECLKCHVTGYNLDASMLGKKFKVEDGVQCETCHGPGSAYKDMKVMKDKDLAIKNGLVVHEKLESFCTSCHNVESPTFVDINIEEAWQKIKHNVPKTEN
ncbi:MAG: cytochrome c family protein [Ignavibacteriaceae bacterium]